MEDLLATVDDMLINLYELEQAEYEIARHDLRMKKYDHVLLETISPAEQNEMNKLEKNARKKHKNYCDAIINVRNVVQQAINANGRNCDKACLSKLQKVLNDLPECPPESDFLNITDIDDDSMSNEDESDDDEENEKLDSYNEDDDYDDEIMISSINNDEDDDNVMAIDENNTRNISLLETVIEKSKAMKKIEAELKKCEELKNQSKTEMFSQKDQQLDTTQHQQFQRNLFNQMNELKIQYRRARAEIKELIQDIVPYLNDDTIGRELLGLLRKIQEEDAAQKSPLVKQPRIPQIKSRIPSKQTRFDVPGDLKPQNANLQLSSIIPQISVIHPPKSSKLPQISTKRPQLLSRLPQTTAVHPQTPSQFPQSSFTQSQAIQHQTPSRIPQVSRIPASQAELNISRPNVKIPQLSQLPRLTSKTVIQRPERISPRQQETSRVQQPQVKQSSRLKPPNLKISDSIGNVRKVKARPGLGVSGIPSQTDKIDKLQLKNLTSTQKKLIKKQTKIKAEDTVNRILDDADKDIRKLISKWKPEVREQREIDDIQSLTESVLRNFFSELGNENVSHEDKIKALQRYLKMYLNEVNNIYRQYRGRAYQPDEEENQRFINSIIDHFNQTKNFENFRATLAEFFKKLPYKKFQIVKSKPKTSLQPKDILKERGRTSTPRQPRDVSRVAAARKQSSQRVKSKVESQLKKLEKSNVEKSAKQLEIKNKLDKFVNSFCKIFILNQKNRLNKFDIWVKIFRLNLRPILNDLDAFYKSLPYPELKKFNKQQVEQSLDRLLHQVYEQTRRYELTNVKCKDLIGNEMKKLMEQKQLKNINTSLGVFLQGIKELMEPYVESDNQTQQEISSVVQKSQHEMPSVVQKSQHSVQRQGPMSMRQKLHESNIQKALHQTLMNETEDDTEYPSFKEALLQQVPVSELQSMYRKMVAGRYKIPDVQTTATQAMMLEKIENLVRKKADRKLHEMAKKRDESFLRGRANQSLEFPIHEKIAPSSINIFKRVIGTNEILNSIVISEEILKAIDIVLECCENIDENIIKVLMNQHRNELSALDDSLSVLAARLKSIIYNNNVIEYGDEIARLDKLHYKVNVEELKSKLGKSVYTKADCDNLLINAFSMNADEIDDVATHAAIEFIRNLRYLQYKYIMKILKDEIRGNQDDIPAPTRGRDTPSETPSTNYLDRVKTVSPVQVFYSGDYPHDMIERDILYVALQLINRNELECDTDEEEDDKVSHMDYLSRFVIQIAEKYQNNSINQRDALRIINQIFRMLPCVPVDFYQTFIYHTDNQYFGAYSFMYPALNTASRIQQLARRDRKVCDEDRVFAGIHMRSITEKIRQFMNVFDNEIEEIARSFQLLDERTKQNIKIGGNELSNNDNGILGNPQAINTKTSMDGKIDNIQLSLVSNQAPVANVANADILQKLNEIDAILDKHLNELDHFENSKIAKAAVKYELQPNAIRRKNYWQCRGSEIPKWFPGFYTIFPSAALPKAFDYSIEQILPHAWRMMAPVNYK